MVPNFNLLKNEDRNKWDEISDMKINEEENWFMWLITRPTSSPTKEKHWNAGRNEGLQLDRRGCKKIVWAQTFLWLKKKKSFITKVEGRNYSFHVCQETHWPVACGRRSISTLEWFPSIHNTYTKVHCCLRFSCVNSHFALPCRNSGLGSPAFSARPSSASSGLEETAPQSL